ncbi:MAG: DegV family protein [Chloroflexota bacterium]|nr:DegV family protein [Chloroflexota bacterium]
MSVKLITDGSVDLPAETLEQYQIGVVPLSVTIDGETLLSRVEIDTQTFYERQQRAESLPTTSLPTPEQFRAAFEEALQSHTQVLCLCISSGLSGTVNSARQAAEHFPDGAVTVRDSLTLSGALGFQLVAAGMALQRGGSLDAALDAAETTHQETSLYFALGELTYLIKGGRIGRVAGTVGSLFNIKPVITVDKRDGIYTTAARVRSFDSAMRKMLELAEGVVGTEQPGRFMVLHGAMEAEADEMERSVRERFDVRWLHTLQISPALGAHTGPHGLGLVAAPGDWKVGQ